MSPPLAFVARMPGSWQMDTIDAAAVEICACRALRVVRLSFNSGHESRQACLSVACQEPTLATRRPIRCPFSSRTPTRRLRLPSEAALASEGMRRRLTAILAADVAGYSRLMELDEARTVRKSRHRAALAPLSASPDFSAV